MKIKGIPGQIARIYKEPSIKWRKELKSARAGDMAGAIYEIVKQNFYDKKMWNYAGMLLSELCIRNYAKYHSEEVKLFRNLIQQKSNICVIDTMYSLEAAGIEKKILSSYAGDKIIHPYPYSGVGKRVIKKWKASGTHVSLSDYISKYSSRKAKKSLKDSSVRYLEEFERAKFLVSFKDGRLFIDGKRPKDGKYMYALSMDKKVMLAGVKEKGKLQHSSFFSGQGVAASGNFEVRKGRVREFTMSSGHYKPLMRHVDHVRHFVGDKLGKVKFREYR